MSSFTFCYPEWAEIDASLWVNKWAEAFLSSDERRADDLAYNELIAKKGQLSGADFEQIGRWKEGCTVREGGKEHGRWKPGTTAAYDVWMEGKQNPPQQPANGKLDDAFARTFLEEWSEKTYEVSKKGPTRFGVARASTLLHFLSAGQFPIYDDFIWYALKRLGTPLPWKMTVDAYLKKFCPLVAALAASCGLSRSVADLRKLDNALRCFGRDQFPMSSIAAPGSLRREK